MERWKASSQRLYSRRAIVCFRGKAVFTHQDLPGGVDVDGALFFVL